MNHKQIAVTLYDGNVLPEIDKPLAGLVKLINRPDLWTTNCCQGDEKPYPDAYIAVDGPLARHLVHRLLDDQLDHPTGCIGGVVFDAKKGESAYAIRWHPHDLKSVVASFKRVLAEKTFNVKIMWRSVQSKQNW